MEGLECINGGETCQCTALILLYHVKHQQKQKIQHEINITS